MADLETDLRAFDRERITVGVGAVGLTAATYNNASAQGTPQHMRAKVAKIFVEGSNNVILDENGGTPSATRGITLIPGQFHVVRGLEGMRNVRLIRAGGSDGAVEVVYYR
jgi:hypothetical protein